MEELDDVGVIEALVYLNLAHELDSARGYFEFGALLDEGGLLDDLDGEDVLVLGVLGDEFVASGESSLAEEVALDVLGDGVGLEAVILDYVEVLVSCVRGGLRSG